LSWNESVGAQALLLDLDGTLVDTAPDLAESLTALLHAEGRESLEYEEVRRYVSDGARGLIRLAFPEADEDRFEVLKSALLDQYASRLAASSRLFDGMREVLETCERHDLPWGVVTNKPSRFTVPLMDALGLADGAACLISGDTTKRAKPYPDPLLLAAEELQLEPEVCLYVGDAPRDIESARAAGMPVLAAAWGYIHVDDDPRDWDADAVIDAPSQLIEMLDFAD
jgi:N-acetyl-D-muramate 6-phosphate phosphatase